MAKLKSALFERAVPFEIAPGEERNLLRSAGMPLPPEVEDESTHYTYVDFCLFSIIMNVIKFIDRFKKIHVYNKVYMKMNASASIFLFFQRSFSLGRCHA